MSTQALQRTIRRCTALFAILYVASLELPDETATAVILGAGLYLLVSALSQFESEYSSD